MSILYDAGYICDMNSVNMKRFLLFGLLAFFVLVSCIKQASVTATSFGHLSTGEEVTLWHIENASGASMDVTDFGCRVVRICMPDRDGVIDDVVVGYGNLETFEKCDGGCPYCYEGVCDLLAV